MLSKCIVSMVTVREWPFNWEGSGGCTKYRLDWGNYFQHAWTGVEFVFMVREN